MTVTVDIGWGRRPRRLALPSGTRVLVAPPPPPAVDAGPAIEAALNAPVGGPSLAARLAGARRVCVLVPDDTRKAIGDLLWPTVRAALERAGVPWRLGIATGKHPPGPPPDADTWVHDARSPALVRVGVTAQGTDVRYPPAVLEADLRIVLSEVRPHYFAGYAGGAKMLFPGVAGEDGIWHNHRLKAAAGARLGVVDGNPCRADMEAAAALAGPTFAINGVRRGDGRLVGVTAGDPVASHRAAVDLARRVYEVPAPPAAPTVLVSDAHPVSASLYQACKLLPPAGRVLTDGGAVILAVALHEGVGPVDIINEAIYRLGVVHSLPARHRVLLVSERPPEAVAPTFATWAPDIETALAMAGGHPPLVLPYAGDLVPVSAPAPGG